MARSGTQCACQERVQSTIEGFNPLALPGKVIKAIAHPADTVASTWHAMTHPLDSAEAVANAVIETIHLVPGVDWAGDRLKDFANTSFGKTCLQIVATYGYYVLTPYLGSFYSSIAFAAPGVFKGDRFTRAWVSETTWRLAETIKVLSANYLDYSKLNVKGLADEEFQKALQKLGDTGIAQHLKSELNRGVTGLAGWAETKVTSELKSRLEAEFGNPPDLTKISTAFGIREDMAAMAWDLVTQNESFDTIKRIFDPTTGNDVLAPAHQSPAVRPPPTRVESAVNALNHVVTSSPIFRLLTPARSEMPPAVAVSTANPLAAVAAVRLATKLRMADSTQEAAKAARPAEETQWLAMGIGALALGAGAIYFTRKSRS